MQIYGDTGPLDARFDVETVDGTRTIVFRSRGGRPVRNADYAEGLDLLLRRLASLDAVLDAVMVDSGDTRRKNVPPADRLLDPGNGRSYPVRLVDENDLAELRLALGRSQAAVGRSPAASGGNPTKQIRLYVTLAGSALSDGELEQALAVGSRILVVALPRSARKNLEWGLENGIWGFPIPRYEATENQRVQEYKMLRRGDRVLLLGGYTGGSPRASLDVWIGTDKPQPNRFTECYLCTVNQPYYLDRVPFWPDENNDKDSRYPHRIGIDPLSIGALSLEAGVDLSASVLEAARRSHIQGAQGFMADAVGSPRLAPVTTPPGQPEQDDEETPGPLGQGRSVDPVRRKRVEERAVQLARARYEDDGWTVKDVSHRNEETSGTPYDLRCSKDKMVRHVEVKGKSRSGDTVDVSANERDHASAPNAGAHSFLFVVEQIGLKTRNGEVLAVGGIVRYDGPFLSDETRFVPTHYRYEVPDDGGSSSPSASV
jgi:hypothetical protein